MKLGILYNEMEWSIEYFKDFFIGKNIDAILIDVRNKDSISKAIDCDMVINRIFASLHFSSDENYTSDILKKLDNLNIKVVNSSNSFYHDISKYMQWETMTSNNIPSPEVYSKFNKSKDSNVVCPIFPAIIKPDCGGRTSHTYIIHDENELQTTIEKLPENSDFLLQEFIAPDNGYITRVEVIGDKCHKVFYRSVVGSGLSSHAHGSTYTESFDLPKNVEKHCLEAVSKMGIEFGSLDVIENKNGYRIIDVNALSNFAEKNIAEMGFDLIKDTADYIYSTYIK